MKNTRELKLNEKIEVEKTLRGMKLKSATVDCSRLFEVVGGKYCLKPSPDGLLDLKGPLSQLYLQGKEDPFLPISLFVRDCMRDIFDKLMRTPHDKRAIVFGSPGVGKSILTFLAVLCYASLGGRPTLFMRKTEQSGEDISIFWAVKKRNKIVDVYFTRVLDDSAELNHVVQVMEVWGLKDEECDDISGNLRIFCDGPKIHDKVNQGGKHASLVTSRGLETPFGENLGHYYLYPLSAWSLEETVDGLRAMKHKTGKRKIAEVYDVLGGKIRDVLEVLATKDIDSTLLYFRDLLQNMVTGDLSGKEIKVAIESTKLSGTKDNKDRVRAMFTRDKGSVDGRPNYETVQYLGSQYLARLLQSSLSLEDTINALMYAKGTGIQSLYGWHFELFCHKIFQVCSEALNKHSEDSAMQSPSFTFDICQGEGTGKESVTYLTKNLLYWMPSIPNFANIDAAIVLEDEDDDNDEGATLTLYCPQYTVSTKHGFNCNTFYSDFFWLIPESVREPIEAVKVVFVVPHGMTFEAVQVPSAQKDVFELEADDLNIEYKAKNKGKKATKGDEEEDDDDEVDDGDDDGDDDSDVVMNPGTPLKICFQWEARSLEYSDVTELPLSFLG